MRAGPKDTTRYVSATAVHVCAGLAAGCRRMSVGCLRLCYGCVLPGADSRIFQTCLKFSRHGHGFAVSAMATRDAQGCTGDPQGCLPDEQGLATAVDTPYYTCMWEGGFSLKRGVVHGVTANSLPVRPKVIWKQFSFCT